ncbi:MAG: toprim domain-containing protein [Chloroflexota bacterium]
MNNQTDTHTLTSKIDLGQLANTTLRGNTQGERFGPCPKCGGTDRFHIKPFQGRDYFFCRKCHPQRGDAIEFMRWLHGLTFTQAVQTLGGDVAALKPLAKPTPQPTRYDMPPATDWQNRMKRALAECVQYLWSDTPKASVARDYLRGRGLSDETIKAWGICYNHSDRRAHDHWLYQGFTLPTIICGDLWQVRTRTPPKLVGKPITGNTKGRVYDKYMGVIGNVVALMNADALKDAHTAIICAGEFDAMLAQQHAPAGVACVTFGSESKSMSLRWLIALRNIKRVIVCYDNDDAGDLGYERIKRDVPKALRARVPAGKDIGDFWSQGGDVAAWSREIVGQPAPDISLDQWENTIYTWLESRGYTPSIGEYGQVIAQRLEDVMSAIGAK